MYRTVQGPWYRDFRGYKKRTKTCDLFLQLREVASVSPSWRDHEKKTDVHGRHLIERTRRYVVVRLVRNRGATPELLTLEMPINCADHFHCS